MIRPALTLVQAALALAGAQASIASVEATMPQIIPEPVSLERGAGSFRIRPGTPFFASEEAFPEARMLMGFLEPALGDSTRLLAGAAGEGAAFELALVAELATRVGEEGYLLDVGEQRVRLRAATRAGLFYGIQTLRQLLPPEAFAGVCTAEGGWALPCVEIVDFPRLAWRGLLLDPARHFIPKPELLRFIDAMALHKLNRLQLHLTDDQGWRIEIRKWPRLTEVGAWRDQTLIGHARQDPARYDGVRHGGFYSQEDVREIVRFAAERHVTLVPEIEMPGHARAAISAYPELGVFPDSQEGIRPWTRWGVSPDILAPRPETIAFCEDVLAEVMELFPGTWIHIGGDEAVKTQWEASEEIQRMIAELGVEGEAGLQAWFTRRIDAFLAENGRRLVGWDEILEGGLAPGAVVMSWRGERGGIAAARAGHDAIMAPTSHTYLDYYQGPREIEPLAIGGFVPLEKVYRWEPVPETLSAEEAERVLGGQGQLWSEYIPDADHLQYMAFPRACALAEVLWSPRGHRSWDFFLLRLERHLERLEAAGLRFRPLDRVPERWEGREDADAPRAARALVDRLLPGRGDAFRFEVIPPVAGRDVFEVESAGEGIAIRGNTALSMGAGLGWYLKHRCLCQVSWYGSQLDLPDPLPPVEPKVRRTSWARYRYFLNYCCFGYSLPFWDFGQWEELIDWMALHGINAPLSVTGQEAVWRAMCERLGMGEEEVREFLAGPPYLPFQWMGCLDGWGGPLPADWIDRHEELGRRILERQRELGMTPVLQGFTGHVPAAVARLHPDAKLHRIRWIEWETHLLDPLDPLFPRIARTYMEEQTSRFGNDHLFAADTFIEMRPPSGEPEDLARLARAIYDGMAAVDPQAVWVLQGWIFLNQRSFWTPPRREAFLGAAPEDRLLLLDLFCESSPMWRETEAFCGRPWLWCNVQSFGGNTRLGGALTRNDAQLSAARSDPDGGRLAGVGFVNEALDVNPAVFDLLYEAAWRDEPVDVERWLVVHARSRYGRAQEEAERAWQILGEVVYGAPQRHRSAIEAIPRPEPIPGPPYGRGRLARAWRLLLEARGDLGEVDAYRFDLVNVARQVLSNHAAVLQAEMSKALGAEDPEAFERASGRFLQLVRDLDELVGTRRELLLGRWIADARRWGATEAERDRLEWNARRVLTAWGEGSAIDDYASKEWSGLLKGYYLERWQRFVDAAGSSLERGEAFDRGAFVRELREWMLAWSEGREGYSSEPSGDSLAVAQRLWEEYGHEFRPDAQSLTTDRPVTCSHALPAYPAHLANDGWRGDTHSYWATDVGVHPEAWWQVDLEEVTEVGRVVVVGYFGDQRCYGFTVEVSLDGEVWEVVADRRENREPSTAEGYEVRFEPRGVRFLRVTLTSNSANTGRHLVEVMAFGR